MKTLDTLDNGDRIVRIARADWDGLASATEIAYQDPDAVPPELRATGERLWRAFHPDEAQAEAERRAIASGGALTPADVEATDRDNAADRDLPPGVARLSWSPFTQVCDGCGNRFRLSWEAMASLAETEITGTGRDSDNADDVEARARSMPFGKVADNAEWCLHCVQGDDAPLDEYVGGENPDRVGERPVAAFVAEGVAFFAYPQGGSFMGVRRGDESRSSTLSAPRRRVLLHVPMNADGTPDMENLGEVENPEGIHFDELNGVLGSDFDESEFAGR
jgi:hypothetical protein